MQRSPSPVVHPQQSRGIGAKQRFDDGGTGTSSAAGVMEGGPSVRAAVFGEISGGGGEGEGGDEVPVGDAGGGVELFSGER